MSIPDQSVGDFPYKLEANASSGLPVSFSSSDPALDTVVGDYIYLQSVVMLQLPPLRMEIASMNLLQIFPVFCYPLG